MFANMANGLAAVNIITKKEAEDLITLYATNPLRASHTLLKQWTTADKAGQRTQFKNTTFIPPPQYAGLKRSTLRTDNIQFAFGNEQKESIDYIINGLTRGFSVHREGKWKPVRFEPYATDDPSEQRAFDEFVEQEMGKGFTCYHDQGIHFDIEKCQINPSFLRQKMASGIPKPNKYRMIEDLSHGSTEFPSVNSGISKKLGAVSFPGVENQVDNILELQDEHREIDPHTLPEVKQSKRDFRHAYRHVPTPEEEWIFLMSTDREGRPIIDSRMQMGLGPAARIFCAITEPQDWLIRYVFHVRSVAYLDDAGQAALGTENSILSHEIDSMWMRLVGFEIAEDKDEVGQDVMTLLGVEIDSRNNTLTIPKAKVERIKTLLKAWRGKEKATVHEVQVITGVLCDISKVVTQGKVFLNRLYQLLHAAQTKESAARHPKFYQVDIGWRQRADLQFWEDLLEHMNSHVTRRFFDKKQAPIVNRVIRGDACDKRIAGIVGNKVWRVELTGEWAYLAKHQASTASREMIVLVINAGTFGHEWKGQHILFECDNESDVNSFIKMSNKNDTTEHLMRVLTLLAILHDFTFEVKWLSTTENEMADDATRLSMCDFTEKWPHLCFLEPESIWRPPLKQDQNWQESITTAILQGRKL